MRAKPSRILLLLFVSVALLAPAGAGPEADFAGEFRLQQRDSRGGRRQVRLRLIPSEEGVGVTHELVDAEGAVVHRAQGRGQRSGSVLRVRFSTQDGASAHLEQARPQGQTLGQISYRRLTGGRLQGRGWTRFGDAYRQVEERGRVVEAVADASAAGGAKSAEGPLEVLSVTVLDAYATDDVEPPHWRRDDEVVRAAAILRGTKLRLRAGLRGEAAGLKATIGRYELVRAEDGAFETPIPVSQSVGLRDFEVLWRVGERVVAKTPLHVQILFRAPLLEHLESRHLENVCEWGKDATHNQPTKQGLSWRLVQQLRHFVHPTQEPARRRVVLDYAPDAPRPLNYDLLPGQIRFDGTRVPDFVFYPPLRAESLVEDYRNYASNFGWRVLDDPRYPGGRCNHQASLMASVLQSQGIEARVHFVERRGVGRRSGRPMRRHFRGPEKWDERLGTSPTSLGWNFHAITEVSVEGGGSWYVDLAFFTEPGTRAEVEAEGGPIVRRWSHWVYDDGPARLVPEADLPE